jgi:hypothetical protein
MQMTTEEQALVCRWLGIPALEPEQWGVIYRTGDGGKTQPIRLFPPALSEVDAIERCVGTDGAARIEAVYPNLLTGDGMLLMMTGLRRRGILNNFNWQQLITDGRSPTLPEALAQAVLALARKERG